MSARQANAADLVLIFIFVFIVRIAGEIFFCRALGGVSEENTARRRRKRFWRGWGWRGGIVDPRRSADCSLNCFREALQHGAVVLAEGIGLQGKCFEQSNYFCAYTQRGGNHGTNAKGATTLAIDTLVGLGIVAAQQFSGANAFAGKTRTDLQGYTHGRGAGAGTGSAEHGAADHGAGDHGTGVLCFVFVFLFFFKFLFFKLFFFKFFFVKSDGSAGSPQQGSRTRSDQRKNRLQIHPKGLRFFLHGGGGAEDVGIVLPKDGIPRIFGAQLGRLCIGSRRESIQEQPLREIVPGDTTENWKSQADASIGVRPGYAGGAGNLAGGFGEIQTEFHGLVDFHW